LINWNEEKNEPEELNIHIHEIAMIGKNHQPEMIL